MTLGEKIRKLRKERDWTQAELGNRSGVGSNNVSSYELGTLKPSRKTLERFANALGISLEELLAEEPEQPVLAIEDPELLPLFRELSRLPEAERTHAKWILSVIVRQSRIQQMMAG
jgi:transcriptional regulator with XRE-family HTH domain